MGKVKAQLRYGYWPDGWVPMNYPAELTVAAKRLDGPRGFWATAKGPWGQKGVSGPRRPQRAPDGAQDPIEEGEPSSKKEQERFVRTNSIGIPSAWAMPRPLSASIGRKND